MTDLEQPPGVPEPPTELLRPLARAYPDKITKRWAWYLKCPVCHGLTRPDKKDRAYLRRNRTTIPARCCPSCLSISPKSCDLEFIRLSQSVEKGRVAMFELASDYVRSEVERLCSLPISTGLEVPRVRVLHRALSPYTWGSWVEHKQRLRVTLWPGVHMSGVLSTVVHELAHALTPGEGHSKTWRRAFATLAEQAYGLELEVEKLRSRAHLDIAVTQGLFVRTFLPGLRKLYDAEASAQAPTAKESQTHGPD